MRSSIVAEGGRGVAAVHARQREKGDVRGSGLFQCGGAGARGGAGSHDIVDQQNPLARDGGLGAEGVLNVSLAHGAGQPGLRRSGPNAPDQARDWYVPTTRDVAGQQFRLVESAAPLLEPVQGHGRNDVEALLARERRDEQIPERTRQGLDAAVFEKVDKAAQLAFVEAETIGRVEAGESEAAGGAEALFIERVGAEKWGAAGGTEIFGGEGSRFGEAGGADGNAADCGEVRGANAALGRKN